jgi:hypothetical protein
MNLSKSTLKKSEANAQISIHEVNNKIEVIDASVEILENFIESLSEETDISYQQKTNLSRVSNNIKTANNFIKDQVNQKK